MGVYYAKETQTKPSEMVANCTPQLLLCLSYLSPVQPSKEFEEFMASIGDLTQLKGFQGYCAGLDTEHDTTGTHTFITKFGA